MEKQKQKVHYIFLDDMEKYVPNFNPDDYESIDSFDATDPSFIEFLRNYYDEHLPVDVTAWLRVNKPRETLLYKESIYDQIKFVRDKISDEIIFSDMGFGEHEEPQVIGTHYSKSVKLPVFKITREDKGIEFILRCNIYDWKVSVCSKIPLDFDFMEIFDKNKVVSPLCCEGFPNDKIYGSFNQDKTKFTIEFYSKYNVYVFFFLIMNYLGVKSHQAA